MNGRMLEVRQTPSGESTRFEYYSELLNKWFSVYVFSLEKSFFTVIFEDITTQKTIHLNLERAMEDAINAVGKAVEARDPYTAGHQLRVAELAVAISKEFGLEDEIIKGIRLGASIHDIGKIKIPAEILTKPARLDDIEIAFVQKHPEAAYEILKGVRCSWPVAKIAHQHHERIDGSGYPLGLKGDDICLEAKIVAVADVVEAMCSHRPYRASLGINAALDEIRRQRGRCLDQDAVDACLILFEGNRFAWQG